VSSNPPHQHQNPLNNNRYQSISEGFLMPKINELKRQELSYRLNSESFKDEVKNKIKWDWVAVVIALLAFITLISRWI
ncbi:hypothetical protein ACOZ9R_07170, partial [Providencia alcalifaciens]|uniref:hypothetical protein n=1 Tax=Providencia alcalifaciens TaxID=126385 RepID=UPI003BF7D7A8